jgi:RNA polymerase sigma-70 factor (ECF subfamily)
MSPAIAPSELCARGHSLVRASFTEVFVSHARFVWRCLRRLGVREADVPDACQEVFIVVDRKLPTLDLSTSPRAWLFGVSARVASDYRRRAHVRSERPIDEEQEVAAPASQITELAHQEARRVLDGILDGLDDEKRAVFILFELEQLPMAEVAEAVGCPIQTAYSRLHAARRQVDAAIRRHQKGTVT